jgi:hypothetical protein
MTQFSSANEVHRTFAVVRCRWSVFTSEDCVAMCGCGVCIRPVLSDRCFWFCLFGTSDIERLNHIFVADKLIGSAAAYYVIWYDYYYYAMRPDGIPSFVIMDCSEIFVPASKFIFNPGLSQNTLLICGSSYFPRGKKKFQVVYFIIHALFKI